MVDLDERREAMLQAVVAHAHALPQGPHALSPRVLAVLRELPRHAFVPPAQQEMAYDDHPLPIGCGKTISQPFIVALMTDLLDVQPHHRVLELGTGLGYQTAVLARLAAEVFSIERQAPLAQEAAHRLASLDLDNVRLRTGNGFDGWPEQAPFDRILVTAAPRKLPRRLPQQLTPGGRLVLPLGPASSQQLTVIDKGGDGELHRREVLAVLFSELEDSSLE